MLFFVGYFLKYYQINVCWEFGQNLEEKVKVGNIKKILEFEIFFNYSEIFLVIFLINSFFVIVFVMFRNRIILV